MNVQKDEIRQIGVFAFKQMVGGLILYVYMRFCCWACKKVGALERLKVTARQLKIFRLQCIVMFKQFSLNNFCISFLIFSALEPLTFLNIASPSSLYKPISFYYNSLKVDKEENYQRLHKPLLHRMVTSNNSPFFFIQTCWPLKSRDWFINNSVFGHFSSSLSFLCSKMQRLFPQNVKQ